jgi:alkylhydroperoxidase/carboxymuconolactone decarboxylase family protein YurZ
MLTPEDALRRLTIGDPALIGALTNPAQPGPGVQRLDDRTEALLRIGALVALDAPQASYVAAVGAADRAGVQPEELVAVLAAVAEAVGSARLIAAAPRIAAAARYEIEASIAANEVDHAQRGIQ